MNENFIVEGYYLDKYQLELLKNNQNTIVIAGAGAGKTLTIIGKINYLIECDHILPKNILVISFTNASVNDLKRKIKYDVDIYTFHKLAISILKNVGYNYTLIDPSFLSYLVKEYLFTISVDKQKKILKFLNIDSNYKSFLLSKEFKSFCIVVETFINLWQTNNMSFNNLNLKKYSKLEKSILLIIFNIYKKYTEEKRSTSTLDFDDLIVIAKNYTKDANLKYQYIIIDEFQDTSLNRLNLIKEIYKYTSSKIIVVGDDWQSIYRFSGCDLNIFLDFKDYFPNVNVLTLVNTYRNSQELINIAANFVLKNPKQIKKDLISFKNNQSPIILAPYKDKIKILKKILDNLILITDDILLLVRNNKDIDSYLDNSFVKDSDYIIYKNKEIKYLTVHRSKGLEAQYVVLLNCNNERLGFPNKIENNKIINKLYPSDEIPYAEERRLFYVAITRCKEQVFIVYDKKNPSLFVKEIKKIIKKKLGKIKYF